MSQRWPFGKPKYHAVHETIRPRRGTPRTLGLLPNGRVLHERTIRKIRAENETGELELQQLEEFGAAAAPDNPD
jgi:hypothetical protein